MYKKLVEKWTVNSMEYALDYTYTDESPNMVYGNWEQVDRHIGGETVKLPSWTNAFQSPDTYWKREDYTPAMLAKEYASSGKPNASAEAYKSLQRELIDDVCGSMFDISLTVSIAGEVFASDSISTACGVDDNPEDIAREMMQDYFNVFELAGEAYSGLVDRIKELQSVA